MAATALPSDSTDTPAPLIRPEVLAPAGDWECAQAAVENGADAIYFGLERFNARMRAQNLRAADLPQTRVLEGTRGTRPLRGVLIILVTATIVVRIVAAQFGWVRLELLYHYVLVGLALVVLALILLFPPVLEFVEMGARELRYLWWLVLLLALAVWLIWGLGKKKE